MAMESTEPGLFGKAKRDRGLGGETEAFERATGRRLISKLTEGERKRVGAASRHNKVCPAVRLRSEMEAATHTGQQRY